MLVDPADHVRAGPTVSQLCRNVSAATDDIQRQDPTKIFAVQQPLPVGRTV
jgi:hypothetical protein